MGRKGWGVGAESYGLVYRPFSLDGSTRKMWETPPAGDPPAPAAGGGKKPPTQEDIDNLYGELRRTKETIKIVKDKLDKTEAEKVQILSRLNLGPGGAPLAEKVVYSENHFPQTEEEWTELYDANPALATDLRYKFNKVRDTHTNTVKGTIEDIVKKHPDMYKRDANGVVQRTPQGAPIPDEESPKYKLFAEIAGDDPTILNVATGAKIVMEAVEHRLKGDSEAKVKAELEEKKKKEEADRLARVAAGGVASGGDEGNAPLQQPVKVEYSSEEEKAHVAKAVARGQFKSVEEYMRIKQSNVIPYGRGGF